MDMQINFPNLGIYLEHVGKEISVFGFSIAFYGIVIVCGMGVAMALILYEAKRTGQSTDEYYNMTLTAILIGIIGARAYYVFFSWDSYKDNPLEVFNIRGGGLAIYGGIIFGFMAILCYSRIRRIRFALALDTICSGLVIGQVMGRWGNFFNREAFGEYTDGLLAMQLPVSAVRRGEITQTMWDHMTILDGVDYIQVSPTYLYESLWNLVLLCLILYILRNKRFDGQAWLTYMMGYGLGRLWIEGLRTDQLLVPGSSIPVSQALSFGLCMTGALLTLYGLFRHRNDSMIVELERVDGEAVDDTGKPVE